MEIPTQSTTTKEIDVENEMKNIRPNRNINKSEIITHPTMQRCKTKMKKVKFENEELRQLKMCHNLITNLHPNPE